VSVPSTLRSSTPSTLSHERTQYAFKRVLGTPLDLWTLNIAEGIIDASHNEGIAVADTPSPPSPEILEKLRQLREELAQKAAQQAPKDANTLAWQQSNAFKRVYPRANGGQIKAKQSDPEIDALFQEPSLTMDERFRKYVAPNVIEGLNSGLNGMFPMRKLAKTAFEKGVYQPVANFINKNPNDLSNADVDERVKAYKSIKEMELRNKIGLRQLPVEYDLSKFKRRLEPNSFPNPDNPIEVPKSLERDWTELLMQPKANGGQVDMDRMRLELMNKGGALPRKKRNAGLKKFLSDSQIKERLYHATPNDFSEFKLGGDNPALSGRAVWMSTDAKRQPASHNIHTKGSNYKQGVNVMPVHVKAKNPLVLDDPTMIEWAREVFAGGSKEFPELLPPHWIDAVKKEGYDSIHFADPYGHGDPHEVIMFEPKKIKSAIGNRGTYDINDPDITKKNGGITHAHHLDIEERPL
jgi:hypothetical protein